MRRMLDPKEVGGLPSTIEFDKDGNRKVSKDLGVDGKLKLKSLVSASNPDGDITKELGGGGSVTYKFDITSISKYIDTKQYNLGDDITFTYIIEDSSTLVVGAAFRNSNVFKNIGGEAGPTFIGYIDYEADPNTTTQTITLRLVCIKSGTITEPQQIFVGIGLTLITNSTRI